MSERDSAWFRPVWFGSLIVISAAITTVFTCVTPFAAFAVVAAATVSRRDAVMLAVALWLTNQAVGFGLLHYPWTASTFAWGAALGVAAATAYSVNWYSANEAANAAWLGGVEMFAPAIVGQVLAINAVTLVGLFALRPLVAGAAALLGRRRRAHASPARLA